MPFKPGMTNWMCHRPSVYQSSTHPVMSALISVHAAHSQHGPAEVNSKANDMCPKDTYEGSLAKYHFQGKELSFYLHTFVTEVNQLVTCFK